MADEQIQKLFKTMDVDGDGKVDLDEFSKALASGDAKLLQFVDPVAALDFELSTPMLVMPFLRFKEQGRIYKSTKTWRDEALSKGWLVKHDKASGKDRDLCVAHLVGPRIHRRDERCDGPVRPGCA